MDSSRKFPDPGTCRIRHVNGDLFECESADACNCPYSFEFGFGFYCKHPERRMKFESKPDE